MKQVSSTPSLDTVRYGLRCLKWRLNPTLMRCPSCRSTDSTRIARKAWITDLVECGSCHLLYRRPQEPEGFGHTFYESEYRSGLTTLLPDHKTLGGMVSAGFQDSDKDLSRKIDVFRTLGLDAPARILDYGSSWGYGVWQLNHAGYRAEGFEVSRMRADFGIRNLSLTIHTDHRQLRGHTYDAVFTNHVLEHVRNPRDVIDQIASALKPGGWLLAFFPNGSSECRRANPERFHCNWGRLHPIYLTHEYCARVLNGRPYWMTSKKYDDPPDLPQLEKWNRMDPCMGGMRENEMMLVARF